MNRGGRELGHLAPGGPEDVRFRSFFGMSVGVVIASWHLMKEHDLLSPDQAFLRYLWTLMFMCLYPKNEAELCTLTGGKYPKTWPYMYALHELNYYVVSTSQCIILFLNFLSTITPLKLFFRLTGRFYMKTG